MITTVTLIQQFTSEDVTSSIEVEDREKCGSPRVIYEPHNPYPLEVSADDTFGFIFTASLQKYYDGHIACQYSRGVVAEDICNELSGCEWETSLLGWVFGTEETCRGQFNYSFIDEYGIDFYTHRAIINEFENEFGEQSNNICEHTAVLDNKTLCEELSCTWQFRKGNYGDSINFDVDDIRPNIGMVSKIWEVTKQIATFKFDFGFENEQANFILYFIIFWFPLIGLGLALYIMIRS